MLCGSEPTLQLRALASQLTQVDSFGRGAPRARRVQKVGYEHAGAPARPLDELTWRLGVVYERRLVEQYMKEYGTEPGTGQALASEDLLPVKPSAVIRPRPPTLTSIPALLATFQNEWDTLALETYNLKEQLARTREELATTLYQHDAAIRVIVRLTRERDEARESLSKVTVTGTAPDGEEMMIDSVEALPEALAERVDEIHQRFAGAPTLPCMAE